ncbi:hypothetical protein FACS189485_05680 [Spirochaetia bacterium]|nr:hypothetical protein FACS189485_05680 [Spirochaetia bacterium]
MPSQILHILFGEDVIAEIYSRIKGRFAPEAHRALAKISGDYGAAFALGCQGPDIFYHNRQTRPVALEYGTLLHRRSYGDFTAGLLKRGLSEGIGALSVYVLGFMTHAALDRFCHPYIVYKSVTLPKPGAARSALERYAHPFFERIIDVLMLALLRSKAAASWDGAAMLAEICKRPPQGLKEMLIRNLRDCFPERAEGDIKLERRIDNTFADTASFYRGTALDYFHPETLPLDIDYLNLRRDLWFYPAGEEREDRRSFPDIYAQAVKAAADSLSVFIVQYFERGIFPIEEIARSIGNSGLSVQDENGKPCAVTRTCPLPLERVIEQQERVRQQY